MAIITWKDALKIHVGELTRADQLRMWNEAGENGLLSTEEEDTLALIQSNFKSDELMTARATRAVFVCREGEWNKLGTGETYAYQEDGETVFTLSFPVQPAQLRELPISLANPWITAAIEANGSAQQAFLFASSLLNSLQPLSEPASANGQSTA